MNKNNLILDYWSNAWTIVHYNKESGRGRKKFTKNKPEKFNGVAGIIKCRMYAIWSNGSSLIFQVGKRKFSIDDTYRCSNEIIGNGKRRKFSIQKDGDIIYQVKYKRMCYKLLNRLDFTYDGLEELLDDFLWHVSNVWDKKETQEFFINLFLPSL